MRLDPGYLLKSFSTLTYLSKSEGAPQPPTFRRPYTALQKQKKRTRLMGYHLFPRKSSNGTRVRVGIIQLSCKLDVNCYHTLIREEKFQCLKVNNFQKWYFVTKIVLTYREKKLSYHRKKTFEIRGWRLRICKMLDITRTIYQTVKGQKNFL